MDEPTFYFCAQAFLDRMGCMTQIERSEVRAESQANKKNRLLFNMGITAANIIFDTNIKKPVFIPLDNLSNNELKILEYDWDRLKESLPVAGLAFYGGKPCVFGAKVADFMTEQDLESFYNKIHSIFIDFSNKHTLAISQYGAGILILCLAFKDLESMETANSFLNHGGHNFHLFRQIRIETWLLNLNTLELIPGKGILAEISKIGPIDRKVGDLIYHRESPKNINEMNIPISSIAAPGIFKEFLELFTSSMCAGDLEVPGEWFAKFKRECLELEAKSVRRTIEKIDLDWVNYERALGEEIYVQSLSSNPNYNILIQDLDSELNELYKKFELIKNLRQKAQELITFRQDWAESSNRLTSIEKSISEKTAKLGELCGTFAKSMFQNDLDIIRGDINLKEAFSEPMHLQEQIKIRDGEISKLRKEEGGLFSKVKIEARIAYLSALSQKDQWQKDSCWKGVGLEVLDHEPAFGLSNSSISNWNEAKIVKKDLGDLESRKSLELSNRIAINKNVTNLFDVDKDPNFPWKILEEKLNQSIQKSLSEVPILYINLGKSFLSKHHDDILLKYDAGRKLSQLDEERQVLLGRLNILNRDLSDSNLKSIQL